MTDVRDVHHAAHGIAVVLERSLEDVFENIGAQIADMREIIDRGPQV